MATKKSVEIAETSEEDSFEKQIKDGRRLNVQRVGSYEVDSPERKSEAISSVRSSARRNRMTLIIRDQQQLKHLQDPET